MGYRSDVAIGLPKEIYALAPPYIKEGLGQEVTEINEYIIIYYPCINWEEDYYDDVKQIMKFLHSLPSDKYGFIRVGEQSDDIEELGNPSEFGIYTKTTIWF